MARAPKVLWTFHGTVAVRSYHAAVEWLGRFVGCVALEWSDAPPPVARLGGCCWMADAMLEIAQPNAPNTPTAGFIERYGPGFLNLALQLDDLRNADAWLTAHGAKPSLPPETGFTFTRPSETCGLQFEWAALERGDWDPHFGAKIPPRPTLLIDAPRFAHWGGMVADPKAAVARLKELCDWPILFERYDAPASQPAAAFSLGDGAMSLYRVPASPEEAAALWGTPVARPRFHHMAFRVRDLARTAAVFAEQRVRILRGSVADGEIVTHPEDTQGLCIVWTDRDIAGDPRGPLR